MKIKNITEILSEHIPQEESWSTGECYGAYNCMPEMDAEKLLYCVTATEEVVSYAKENSYDLIIQHHPFAMVDFPVIIMHTALDCCQGGLNDMWKDFFNLQDAKHFDRNLGWYGSLRRPIKMKKLIKKIEKFVGGIDGEIICKNENQKINSVVLCTGLGGMVMEQAKKTKADVYVTGELYGYYPNGYQFKGIIEVGHTRTERMGINLIRKILKKAEVQVDLAPFEYDYFSKKEHGVKEF